MYCTVPNNYKKLKYICLEKFKVLEFEIGSFLDQQKDSTRPKNKDPSVY